MTGSSSARRTALVTGASSGIGLATATALVARGFDVIGTSRRPSQLPDRARVPGVRYLPLDLERAESIAELSELTGPVDVLVNNAGESPCGPLEDVPIAEARRLFQVNVFGPLQVAQQVLPAMRERGYGRIVMVGSMLASFPVAHRSTYVATKAALKGLSDAARFEAAPFGVWFTSVEPGSVATGIDDRRTRHLAEDSPYRRSFDTVLTEMDRRSHAGVTAAAVAEVIVRAIEADPPRPLYAVGSSAPLLFALQRSLPRGAVHRIVARAHGLGRAQIRGARR